MQIPEQRQPALNRSGEAGMQRAAAVAVELTPKDVFDILQRHVVLIVCTTICGLILGCAGWYLIINFYPKYTAQTFVRVLPPGDADPTKFADVQVAKEIQYGYRLSMVSVLTQQSTMEKLISRDKIQQTAWFESFGTNKDKSISKAVRNLKKHLNVFAQRDGEYIIVSMTCRDKVESATIVNELVELFLSSQGGTKRAEVAAKLSQLTEQRDSVQRELDAAEKSLEEVRNATKFTDLDEHQFESTIARKLNDLEVDQNKLLVELKEVETNIKTLERQATGPINEQIKTLIETDPTMIMLTQQLAAGETQLAGQLAKFGENHKVVRQTEELINETRLRRDIRKQEIAEQTRQSNLQNAQDNLLGLQSRSVELEKMRQETAAQKRDLDLAKAQYEKRVSVRDERKKTIESIIQQIEKLKIVHDSPDTPKVQFVGLAPVPLEVSSPRLEFYFPGGTMLGLMLGLGLAFLFELTNELLRTPRDVTRYLHIPLLGVIPAASDDGQVGDADLCHLVRQVPHSIISESYRRFRTTLKLSVPSESVKVLLISSGTGGEGKTSLAVNLAAAFVAENKKVLLIDANFRRPGLQAAFPQPTDQPPQGLSDLLMGQSDYRHTIVASGVEGLDLIYTGPLPPNPAELFGRMEMTELLSLQRQVYDYVIIDGPPVLLVSDVKVLARVADGTVLVFNAGIASRGAALRTVRELREINASVLGCVLFAVKALKGGYYQEQFKSYQKYQELQLTRTI